MIDRKKSARPVGLAVDYKIKKDGLAISVNQEKFPIIFPKAIWRKYGSKAKKILGDNLAYSSTLFLPLILDLSEIRYKTARPIAETFLFKNGIYDMPICANVDRKSSLEYIKKFFNARQIFGNNQINTHDTIFLKPERKKHQVAIIPFSFGKESLLTLNLCLEIGIKPILVYFMEPSHDLEYRHKKQLIKKFEKETGLKVFMVFYGPGKFRYGKYWRRNTELGWGLQTTDYALLSLPLANYFKADFILLGNERSCDAMFFDKEKVLNYISGYDQHSDWIAQQGMLASLILGRKIEIASLVEPLYESAITRILHQRYPEYAKYQMSCLLVDDKNNGDNRWCQNCVKCGSIYALFSALNIDAEKLGFNQDLFTKRYSKIYNHFFSNKYRDYQFGSVGDEELGLALYLSYLNGQRGYTIDKFKRCFLGYFKKNKLKFMKKYLGINGPDNLPGVLRKKILNIYKQELKNIS